MIRYTTPTHEHKVKGIDLSGCDVWVSYQQGQAAYKKANGSWVQQSDLTQVFSSGTNYVKG